jgi:hypothetical protein
VLAVEITAKPISGSITRYLNPRRLAELRDPSFLHHDGFDDRFALVHPA